jgi:multidrug resistance protein, MATE family
MKTTDTALLGHVSASALAAAALSDLWTMCTGVLIQGRVLGILVGGAIGAGNPKLAGIYLQVSYLVLAFISIIVIGSWLLTEQVWVAFGSDPKVAKDAGYYSSVLALSIPGIIMFSQLSQFFSAQRIMHPEVVTSSAALLFNLIFGLVFVLGVPFQNFNGYGFRACPIVTTSIVYVQILVFYVVYIHIQQLHRSCWDGWSTKAITWERIKTFSHLYVPSACGTASDFWRVAIIGSIAAGMGEVNVAVFNTSYRIMWIVLILVSAISGASGIKMSMRLGQMNIIGAKQAAKAGILLNVLILGILFFLVALNIRTFGRIFTNDPVFLALFEAVRWPFTVTLVSMNLAVAIEKIPYSMGRTTEVFWYGLIASWGAQVPAVILLTRYWSNDLIGLFWGMAYGYIVLCGLYSFMAFTSDWEKYALLAVTRAEGKKELNDI